jgi:hypothetical protein
MDNHARLAFCNPISRLHHAKPDTGWMDGIEPCFLACLLLRLPSPQTSVPPTQSASRADGTFDNECCASTAKRLPDNAHDCWCTARAPMCKSPMVVATTTGRIVSETYASDIGRQTAASPVFRHPIPHPMSTPAHGPGRLVARPLRLSLVVLRHHALLCAPCRLDARGGDFS